MSPERTSRPTYETVIDLSGQHELEEYFSATCPEDPRLQSLHLTMAYGLLARECRIAYNSSFSPDSPFGGDSQEEYARLTAIVHSIADIRRGTLTDTYDREELWGELYDKLRDLRYLHNDDSFRDHLGTVRKLQRDFLTNGKSALPSYSLQLLTAYSEDVRTATELIVTERMQADDLESLATFSKKINPKLWNNFADEYYWQKWAFPSLPHDVRVIEKLGVIANMREVKKV